MTNPTVSDDEPLAPDDDGEPDFELPQPAAMRARPVAATASSARERVVARERPDDRDMRVPLRVPCRVGRAQGSGTRAGLRSGAVQAPRVRARMSASGATDLARRASTTRARSVT